LLKDIYCGLFDRFLQMYPEHPEHGERIEICLDEVAGDLRMYFSDITQSKY